METSSIVTKIFEGYKKLETSDTRTRYQLVKDLAHLIKTHYKKDQFNAEELDIFIKIIKQAVHWHGNRYSKILSKLLEEWLEKTGHTNIEVILKKNGKINSMLTDTDYSTIALASASWFEKNTFENFLDDPELLKFINQGECSIFHLACPDEGSYNIQIRVVDAAEPLLTAKEFKCVLSSTEIAVVHLDNSLIVKPLFEEENPENRILATVEPGNYKVCVYHFHIPKKVESFYIVLAKTDLEAENHQMKITHFDLAE